MKFEHILLLSTILLLTILVLLAPETTLANLTGTAFDTPSQNIIGMLTGPWARTALIFFFIVAAFAICAIWFFGGEIRGFTKVLIQVALGASLILFASSILAPYFDV